MRRSPAFYVILLFAGICAIAASFFFNIEEFKAVSGTLIGIGAGSAGVSISNLLMIRAARKNPELEKQAIIDYHDERNTVIRNRAKAKAADITQWLIMAIVYVTILISVNKAAPARKMNDSPAAGAAVLQLLNDYFHNRITFTSSSPSKSSLYTSGLDMFSRKSKSYILS